MRLRTLVSKLVSVTALRLGMAGLGFALFWLLSHHLSPAELGGFSLLMGIFMFLQMLPLLGLNVHVVREMAAHPQGQAEEIAAAASLALLMCGLMAGGLCAYALLQADGALKTPLVLLGLSLLPTGWVVVAESALVGRERLSVLTTVNLLENAWRVGGAALSLWLGWGLGLCLERWRAHAPSFAHEPPGAAPLPWAGAHLPGPLPGLGGMQPHRRAAAVQAA
jgi:O-antigen/teichoic acid export membrane protein